MYLSNKIQAILRSINSDISNIILSGNIKSNYNYIDITNESDTVSFISNVKLEQALTKLERNYEIRNNEKFLKHSKANKSIFKELGYIPKGDKPNRIDVGSNGKVIKEVVSKTTGKTYCLFESKSGTKIPVNKDYIRDITDMSFLWKVNRNSIKIGRLIRAILTHSDATFTEKDIESFVNSYKTYYDVEQSAFKKFRIVKGIDIKKWYSSSNYIENCGGQLNNSCMKNSPSGFFNFYKDNGIKMLILHTDGGKIVKNEYISDKIKGRALLWEGAKLGDIEITFLDRIYTHRDSDISLFKEMAKLNGWYWKDNNGYFTNGFNTIKSNRLSFKLKKSNFRKYPYVDTLCYIDKKEKMAYASTNSYDIELRRTDGSYR